MFFGNWVRSGWWGACLSVLGVFGLYCAPLVTLTGQGISPSHPIIIWLWMSVVVGWIWATARFLGRGSPNAWVKLAFWCFFVVVVGVYGVVLFEICWPLGWIDKLNGRIAQTIAFLAPVLVLSTFIWGQSTTEADRNGEQTERRNGEGEQANGKSGGMGGVAPAKEERKGGFPGVLVWGQFTTILVMVLALFAFGIKGGAGSAQVLVVDWAGLPAILIIFVLTELGVHLVKRSEEVGASVQEAGNAAQSVSEDVRFAKTAVDTATKEVAAAGAKAEAAVEGLLRVTELMASDLWKNAEGLRRDVGFEGNKDFWEALYRFANSWAAGGDADRGKASHANRLMGDLFNAFAGESVSRGSVRRQGGNVVCITADSVFAEASKRWLDTMMKNLPENSRLVVRAVSRLLPTQFAFPGLFLGGELGDKGTAGRVESFNLFVGAVVNLCRREGRRALSYERVTLLTEAAFEGLDGSKEMCTLRSWWVWDPRIGGSDLEGGSPDMGDVAHQLGLTLEHWDSMRPAQVGKLFNVKNGDEKWCGVFPLHAEKQKKAVWVQVQVGREEFMKVMGLQPGTVTGMREEDVKWLKDAGWMTVLDWYVEGLHRRRQGGEGGEAAVWAVEGEGTKRGKFPLAIGWDGTKVSALDLLLIGAEVVGGGRDGDVVWHAAALSNLSLGGPTCLVELVTERKRLAELAACVDVLAGRAEGRAGSVGEGCGPLSGGEWKDWPVVKRGRGVPGLVDHRIEGAGV